MYAIVISTQHKVSPLIQCGLKIPIHEKVIWGNDEKMNILREKIMELNYSIDEDYVDASREI